jgi:hypothetical protein
VTEHVAVPLALVTAVHAADEPDAKPTDWPARGPTVTEVRVPV